MNKFTSETVVVELVSTILQKPVDRLASRDSEANWDSLKHIQIIFAFEERFSRQLTEEEMAKIRSVEDLVVLAGK